MIGDQRRQGAGQAGPFVGARKQQHAAIGADQAPVERRRDLLAARTWQGERETGIVVRGGHGGFCPGMEKGVNIQSLCDFRPLRHVRQ